MVDIATIWLADADFTKSSGESLANTIYRKSLTIGLVGDLGAGKTTFLQGFLKGLGVKDAITSPTYALEQRYAGAQHDIIHIDLYRLKESQAKELLSQTDDFEGIRCIEWVNKAGSDDMCDILISLKDGKDRGRDLDIEFRDMTFPSKQDITQWREDVHLPVHIQKHCDAVADFSLVLAKDLMKQGIIIRPMALCTAGCIHDLFRFVDFKTAHTVKHTSSNEEQVIWNTWKAQYPDMTHESACAEFLCEHGHTEFASIVRTHGLCTEYISPITIEQKLLFYADKRVMEDTIVTLQERFDDFAIRYADGKKSDLAKRWLKESLALEKEIIL